MQKYTSFKDIRKLTLPGNYDVNYALTSLPRFILEQQEEAGLQLNPDFQRGHVWSETQQIAFVEFLLRDGRSGRDLYFNCPSWMRAVKPGAYNDFVCVDGLQRITAISRFIGNEIQAFGSYFSEYSDPRMLVGNTMRININNLDSKEKVLRWYLEMNSGGTPHSENEIKRVSEMLRLEEQGTCGELTGT